MNSYTDIDGVPVAADPGLLTDLLRDDLGFTGTVVADYFSVAFLQTLHGVAGTRADAAGLALAAGIDVELPTVELLRRAAARRAAPTGRSTRRSSTAPCERVLRQKCELGLLDPDWSPDPDRRRGRGRRDLDDDRESRALARELPARSVVLLANDGTLPLAAGQRVAVVGPRADDRRARCSAATRSRMHVGRAPPRRAAGRRDPDRARRAARRPGRVHGDLRARLPGARRRRRRHRRGGRGGRGRRRLRRGARRPGRPVRARHLGRGLRRRRPAAARPPGGAARGAARHRHAGGAGAARRPAVRPVPPGRPARRRRVRLLPRRGGRAGARRRAERAGQPVRPAAGQLPGRRARPSPSTYLARPARPAQPRSAPSTRPRCSRSGTGCPTPRPPGSASGHARRRSGRPTAAARSR